MNKLIFIFLLFSPITGSVDYPLKNGKPTSEGIEQYIEDMGDSIVMEYQQFVGDTLYDVWIYTDNPEDNYLYDSMELGRYYPNEIYVTTAEMFIAYELGDLSQKQRRVISESNRFVKATVIHELTHDYINQIDMEMRSIDSIHVNRSYHTNLWIIRSYEQFGSSFIEEGICEYMAEKMGELIPPENPYIPKTIEDITNRDNRYLVNYKYSAHYLKAFLDAYGIKPGVKILLQNAPPTYEEIITPDLFFSRLARGE